MNREYEDAQDHLTELLCAISEIHQPESRSVVISMLTGRGYRVPEPAVGSGGWSYCYQVIRAVANQPNALQQLGKSIYRVGSTGLADRFSAEVSKVLPTEIFTLSERFNFIQDIARYVSPDEYNSLYSEAADGQDPVRDLVHAVDLVDALEGRISPSGPCHPLVMLTESISRKATLASTKAGAHEWSNRLAKFIDGRVSDGIGDAESERLRAFRQRDHWRPADAIQPAILVNVIEPWGPQQNNYLYRLLMYRGKVGPESLYVSDSARDLDGIQEKVIAELQYVIKRLSRLDPRMETHLEFFVPRSLLSYPIEDWSSQGPGGISIGMLYPVVVRDLDRLRDSLLWKACARKWERTSMADDTSRQDRPLYRWIMCTDPPAGLSDVLPDQCVALGLTFPPPPHGHRTDLMHALDAGTPIALWPRHRCDHLDDRHHPNEGACLGARFKADVGKHIAGHRLTELPALVQQMRQERGRSDEDGLVLLWDDPAHFPGVSDHYLAAPGRLEES